MTGPLWYLAESGAALAVFFGVYRLALKNDTHFQAGRLDLLASLAATPPFTATASEISDPVQLEKFQKELDGLSRQREELKAVLAKMRTGK